MTEKSYIHALLLQARCIGHITSCKRGFLDCPICAQMILDGYNATAYCLGDPDIFEGFKKHGYNVFEEPQPQ